MLKHRIHFGSAASNAISSECLCSWLSSPPQHRPHLPLGEPVAPHQLGHAYAGRALLARDLLLDRPAQVVVDPELFVGDIGLGNWLFSVIIMTREIVKQERRLS